MTGRRARAVAFALAGLLAVSALRDGRAADPVAYSVTIAPTGDAAIDRDIHDAATLVSLRDNAAVGPFALVARARADLARFTTVLESAGYYDGRVGLTIAGRDLDDPDLPAALEALPQGGEAKIAVSPMPGPEFHLGRIDLLGEVPAQARATFGLQPGHPARAAEVIAARDRLLAALRASGHALAKVGDPVGFVRPQELELDVSMNVDAGPRVALGRIAIDGLARTHEDFVRRRLLLHPGETFDPAAIEAARQNLAAVGAFASVRIDPAAALDAQGRLPMQVTIAERTLRTVDLGAGYSTDLGGSASATWTHHNLFGNAEQLTLSAAATNLGGTASLAPGYKVSAALALPDWQLRDQTLGFNATAVDETLQAYARRAVLGGTTLERKLGQDLAASIGAQLEKAHIVQEGEGRDYTLLQLPVDLRYDTTHTLLDPTRGLRANVMVTPSRGLGNAGSSFVIAQVSGSAYLDVGALLFGSEGRSVLAARALAGAVAGASTFDIPPDQRFYAGGGGSVRGFRFQSIGPHFADDKPVGGTAVDVGSVEFRQRIGESYGAVAFVDAGQVGGDGVPFEGGARVGAGLGARYYTSFGPIRLDFAVPVTRQPGGDAFEVYVGIGQAF